MGKSAKKKKCPLDLTCEVMMQAPIECASNCRNYQICRAAKQKDPDEEFDIFAITESGETDVASMTRNLAAMNMLLDRGCGQSLESFQLPQLIKKIRSILKSVESKYEMAEYEYIAPPNCWIHEYSVNRPAGRYVYYKLSSPEAIFTSGDSEEPITSIHLNREDDPRYLQARKGIERRNQLSKIRTQLENFAEILDQLISEEF